MKLLLTIAARGGSKGVANKNIRMLANHPLIGITIRQAQKWGQAEHIVVTTDSEAIAEVAREYGAEVPFLRPAEMATDTAGKVPALRHALLEMEKRTGSRFDAVLDLDPTAPIRKIADLDACLALFQKQKPKTLFSVVKAHKSPYFNMVEVDAHGFANLSKNAGLIQRRQDAPAVYAMNASIYIYQREYLANPETQKPVSDQSIIYEMDEWAGIDIDREIDFKFIDFLLREGSIRLEI